MICVIVVYCTRIWILIVLIGGGAHVRHQNGSNSGRQPEAAGLHNAIRADAALLYGMAGRRPKVGRLCVPTVQLLYSSAACPQVGLR